MAIYKISNTEMGSRIREVSEDSGECSKRFRGMFKRIPGNVRNDSGEYP